MSQDLVSVHVSFLASPNFGKSADSASVIMLVIALTTSLESSRRPTCSTAFVCILLNSSDPFVSKLLWNFHYRPRSTRKTRVSPSWPRPPLANCGSLPLSPLPMAPALLPIPNPLSQTPIHATATTQLNHTLLVIPARFDRSRLWTILVFHPTRSVHRAQLISNESRLRSDPSISLNSSLNGVSSTLPTSNWRSFVMIRAHDAMVGFGADLSICGGEWMVGRVGLQRSICRCIMHGRWLKMAFVLLRRGEDKVRTMTSVAPENATDYTPRRGGAWRSLLQRER
jgi:hypothetical protein